MPRNVKKSSKTTRKQQTARLLNTNQANHQSHPAIGKEASIYRLTAVKKVQNINRLLEKQLNDSTANCWTTQIVHGATMETAFVNATTVVSHLADALHTYDDEDL